MAEEYSVTLHGGGSPYSKRVELALKLKGIPFKFVEEDLRNKSPLLLKYNPVYKKIPVLVHNGKPISESLIILEYIEETWKNNGPTLLPEDPYNRAQIRFWVSFFQQQLLETFSLVFFSDGETQERAVKELYEKFAILEEGTKELFPDGFSSFDGKNLSFLDILMCTSFGTYKIQEEVLGIKVIDPEKNPLIFSWVTALCELPVVKELLPAFDEKIVQLLHGIRNDALNSSRA